MNVKKAGCFLIKKETSEIALIYRKKHNDYSFPKGHVEINVDGFISYQKKAVPLPVFP